MDTEVTKPNSWIDTVAASVNHFVDKYFDTVSSASPTVQNVLVISASAMITVLGSMCIIMWFLNRRDTKAKANIKDTGTVGDATFNSTVKHIIEESSRHMEIQNEAAARQIDTTNRMSDAITRLATMIEELRKDIVNRPITYMCPITDPESKHLLDSK